MTPIRFGQPASSLYGAFHPAGQRSVPARAVLLCNPFGQEAVRIHRFLRVLAERLARQGIACLRFDYHASGESMGEDHEADLDQWARDITTADALLRQRAGAQAADWVMPRLAGALAARASSALATPPRQIVFWDPVTDGARYLNAVQQAHAATLATLPDGGALAGEDEVLGFGVSALLLEQIGNLSLADYQGLRCDSAVLIAPQEREGEAADLAAALQAGNTPVRRLSLTIDFDWTSEEALNTALVPADALNMLGQVLQEGQA